MNYNFSNNPRSKIAKERHIKQELLILKEYMTIVNCLKSGDYGLQTAIKSIDKRMVFERHRLLLLSIPEFKHAYDAYITRKHVQKRNYA